uniref:Uncharacterized protein n=1 Tax=Panagrolaimus sp. JU765 TaxID=591449 RepID=A0AC34RL69_9BILA
MINSFLFDNEKQNFTVDENYNVYHDDDLPNSTLFLFNLIRRYKNEKHVGYSLVGCFFLTGRRLRVHCYYFVSKKWTHFFDTSCSYFKRDGTPYFRDVPSNGSDIHLLVYFYNYKMGCQFDTTTNESKVVNYPFDLRYDAFSGKTYKAKQAPESYHASIFNSVCMSNAEKIHHLIKYGENQTANKIHVFPRHYFFFDYNQAGKPITSFCSKFLTEVKFSTKEEECHYVFTNVKTLKEKSFRILCYPDEPEVSFGTMRNFDDKFHLWACFLIYKNYSPVLFCHVLNDSRVFDQDFFYRFQNCTFDCEGDKCGKELNYTPNIIIGNFYGKSEVLNGISINFNGTACHLEVKNGKVVNESKEEKIKYHGYDAIKDEMLSHTDGSIGAIVNVTNELFVRRSNNSWSRYDFPEDSFEAVALIDEKWFTS